MCFLFSVLCSESCYCMSGRIDYVGWTFSRGLARGEDGRGWSTRLPQEIPYFLCKISAVARHLITSQF